MRALAPLALLLAVAALPVAAQQPAERADACKRDAARFADTFLGGGATPAAGRDAVTTAVPSTGRADAEREMAQRGGVVTPSPIGSGINAAPGDRGSAAEAPADQPGTRQGARLGEDERRRMRDLVGEAQAAAGRGDTDGCLQRLREARTLARETGFGSGQPNPGGAAGRQDGAGSGTSGAGSLTPTPQVPGATPGARTGGRAGSDGGVGGGMGGAGGGAGGAGSGTGGGR
ncbi:MAG TPA: hypothetical protein VD995_08660 [Azospirillum sp.]|nr:hypothetical protein [Azospirillum sp.]